MVKGPCEIRIRGAGRVRSRGRSRRRGALTVRDGGRSAFCGLPETEEANRARDPSCLRRGSTTSGTRQRTDGAGARRSAPSAGSSTATLAGRDAPESRSRVAFWRRVGTESVSQCVPRPCLPHNERFLTLGRLDDVREVREIDVEPTGKTDSYSPSRQRSRRNLDASLESLRGSSLPP